MADKKLSKERLKLLGDFLEDQMRKDKFVPSQSSTPVIEDAVKEVPSEPAVKNEALNSISNNIVPQHILDQYATVIKPKKKEEKQDSMTDSGVSSETENLEEDKNSKIKKLMTQFEKTEPETVKLKTNLSSMDDLAASSETMKLERKNPHLKLTDTLKKALKQPLPSGPPPKKPPRVLNVPSIPENIEKEKLDAKIKLEKLEKLLQKREAQGKKSTEDVNVKKPKEIHYLCTEILDITQRTLLNSQEGSPLKNCLTKLNCTVNHSMSSLPYTRLDPSARDSLNNCCTCSNNSLDRVEDTFLSDKCAKCMDNVGKQDGFQCYLNCTCKDERSEFFVDEHIYDEPYVGDEGRKSVYGTLNGWKISRSLEDLRREKDKDPHYDIPSETPKTPEDLPRVDFKKLRQSFESGFHQDDTLKTTKTPPKLRIDSKIFTEDKLELDLVNSKVKYAKSSENLHEDGNSSRRFEKKHSTEGRKFRISRNNGSTVPKRNTQQDVDRENLNRLMNEIYDTVTAACNMDDSKPGSFPIDLSDGASEESVKLSRSLTEKRKNYVRRVSSRVAYLEPKNIKHTRFRHQTSICSYKSEIIDNPYSTFRSWKSFRTSQNNLTRDKMERDSTDSKVNLTDSTGNILSMKDEFDANDTASSIDNMSIDEKTGCVDIDLSFEPRERGLFNVCLLVGLNYMTGEAYVKSVFPSQVKVPPHIENLIFPETLTESSKGEEWTADARDTQCYSLVLTDERGERSYGYCRRVLPEGASTCLPLCYCLIGRYRAPGFYYKVLQELESHHGSSEVAIQSVLQQLFEIDFPNPNEDIIITYNRIPESPILSDTAKCQTMPDMRRSGEFVDRSPLAVTENDGGHLVKEEKKEKVNERVSEFYDVEHNNNRAKGTFVGIERPRTKAIRYPLEPRVDEENLSILLDQLGAGLVIKVFGSLLLERKVVVIGDQLSPVSSCLEALQAILYPLVWQQPLIASVPRGVAREVLEAPLPLLAGVPRAAALRTLPQLSMEEGMLIDLNSPTKVMFYQGDESTILPTSSYKTLKTSLQMESGKNKDREDSKTRNVMISEAFLRFFVDILGDVWKYLGAGVLKDGDMGKGNVVFDKESYIKNASSKQKQYFLEWFTETAMFNHFIQNMAALSQRDSCTLVDTPLPNFYELFELRVRSRSKHASAKQPDRNNRNNYRNALNRNFKLLRTKLRDLVD